jgi:hypothetical protein
MLRFILGICLLTSCSLGVVKTGGQKSYNYDVSSNYFTEELKELAPNIIETHTKEPPIGKRADLFSAKQKPIKRIGIVVFETIIQPTYDGLAGKHKVYLSESGKQLLAENFLKIWQESFLIMSKDLTYISVNKIKRSPSYELYGTQGEDFIKVKRQHLMPDDIFYLPQGNKTTMQTTMSPRGMRDFSLVLVPAAELMQGPKFSEHSKHFINDICKELKIDAVLVVMSRASWTAAQTDKHSGEFIPEEINLKIESTLLLPFSSYHERLRNIGSNDEFLNINLPFAYYQGHLRIPALISVSPELENFKTIEEEIIMPLMKSYKDLTQMIISKMGQDLKVNP